jgi:hypothetical protein
VRRELPRSFPRDPSLGRILCMQDIGADTSTSSVFEYQQSFIISPSNIAPPRCRVESHSPRLPQERLFLTQIERKSTTAEPWYGPTSFRRVRGLVALPGARKGKRLIPSPPAELEPLIPQKTCHLSRGGLCLSSRTHHYRPIQPFLTTTRPSISRGQRSRHITAPVSRSFARGIPMAAVGCAHR